jgi:hypothetical protein
MPGIAAASRSSTSARRARKRTTVGTSVRATCASKHAAPAHRDAQKMPSPRSPAESAARRPVSSHGRMAPMALALLLCSAFGSPRDDITIALRSCSAPNDPQWRRVAFERRSPGGGPLQVTGCGLRVRASLGSRNVVSVALATEQARRHKDEDGRYIKRGLRHDDSAPTALIEGIRDQEATREQGDDDVCPRSNEHAP